MTRFEYKFCLLSLDFLASLKESNFQMEGTPNFHLKKKKKQNKKKKKKIKKKKYKIKIKNKIEKNK